MKGSAFGAAYEEISRSLSQMIKDRSNNYVM
jgi:hypothetical protein